MSLKATVEMDVAPEGEGLLEELGILFNLLLAKSTQRDVSDLGLKRMSPARVRDAVVFGTAMLFDHGRIVINGKEFRPKLAFVGDDGAIVPGWEDFDHLHEYATIFDDDLKEDDKFQFGSSFD